MISEEWDVTLSVTVGGADPVDAVRALLEVITKDNCGLYYTVQNLADDQPELQVFFTFEESEGEVVEP